MLDTTAAPRPSRLHHLLVRSTAGLDEDVVAEARALGPERATDIIVALLEAELSHPTADGSAVRAAHLARELRLAGAVPSLVRCVVTLGERSVLGAAAHATLSRLGSLAVDELVASFGRCDSSTGRGRIAEVLSLTAVKDDRIRPALVRILEDDPGRAARLLAESGEWRAVPELSRAFDRLLSEHIADPDVRAHEDLRIVALALRVLGAPISGEQARRWDDLLERAHAERGAFEDNAVAAFLPAPARDDRLGRNDPCRCGSGRKYKKCHLDEDERKRSTITPSC
jgi:hypothetical protein